MNSLRQKRDRPTVVLETGDISVDQGLVDIYVCGRSTRRYHDSARESAVPHSMRTCGCIVALDACERIARTRMVVSQLVQDGGAA